MDSYDSRYPYEYYEIGMPYAFYGLKSNAGNPATKEQIDMYSSILLKENSNDELNDNEKYSSRAQSTGPICRFVAVVVDKTYSTKGTFITVMFKNVNNGLTEFLTRKYAVAKPSGCYFDGNESMMVQSSTSFNNSNKVSCKQGGITLDTTNIKAGITIDNNSQKIKGVGGITLDTANIKDGKTFDNNSKKVKGVGGITLDTSVIKKRVGGITLDINLSPTKIGGITLDNDE